jgi:hypothetical protein
MAEERFIACTVGEMLRQAVERTGGRDGRKGEEG